MENKQTNSRQTEDLLKAQAVHAKLITAALHSAAQNSKGIWLNARGKRYPKVDLNPAPSAAKSRITVSPFNALILAIQSDLQGWNTNLYYHRDHGEDLGSIGNSRARVYGSPTPFIFIRWNEYAHRNDPEIRISAAEYRALSSQEKRNYKGVPDRTIHKLYNLAQTKLGYIGDNPKSENDVALAERNAKLILTEGGLSDRGFVERWERDLARRVNSEFKALDTNLVKLRRDAASESRYDAKRDAVYMPSQAGYDSKTEYYCDKYRQVSFATGSGDRLARDGQRVAGKSQENASLYEKLVAEVAAGVKMLMLDSPATISAPNRDIVDQMANLLEREPTYIQALESDVNKAIALMERAIRSSDRVETAQERVSTRTMDALRAVAPALSDDEVLALKGVLARGGYDLPEQDFVSLGLDRKKFLEAFGIQDTEGEAERYDKLLKQCEDEGDAVAIYESYAECAQKRVDRARDILSSREATVAAVAAGLRQMVSGGSEKAFVVVEDPLTRTADVIVTSQARYGGSVIVPGSDKRKVFWKDPHEVASEAELNNPDTKVVAANSPGMRKDAIRNELARQGFVNVRFFERQGDLAYDPSDLYFDGKQAYTARLSGRVMERVSALDLSALVLEATIPKINKLDMVVDQEGKAMVHIEPEEGPKFQMYVEKEDRNLFFNKLHAKSQANSENKDALERDFALTKDLIARDYMSRAAKDPSLKRDIYPTPEIPAGVDVSSIRTATFYSRKAAVNYTTGKAPTRYLASIYLNDAKFPVTTEISRYEFQGTLNANDVEGFKHALAGVALGRYMAAHRSQSQSSGEGLPPAGAAGASGPVVDQEEAQQQSSGRSRR